MSGGARGGGAPIGVVGLGVMGGSLVRRLSADGRRAFAWSPHAAERAAAAELAGVEPRRPAEMTGCAGIVLAVPMGALDEVLSQLPAEDSRAGAWIQDVASLQGPALAAFARAGLAGSAVSAHPMAGSHETGFVASQASLYDGTRVWLSHGGAGEAVQAAAVDFWTEVGAHATWIDARAHDDRMGWVSHLPQVVSTELAAVLAGAGWSPDALGPGGLDMTRLAASSPEMWAPLLEAAPGSLPLGLRQLARALEAAAQELDEGRSGEIARRLARTREWRGGR